MIIVSTTKIAAEQDKYKVLYISTSVLKSYIMTIPDIIIVRLSGSALESWGTIEYESERATELYYQ